MIHFLLSGTDSGARLLRGPSIFHSPIDSRLADTKASRPLRGIESLSVSGQQAVHSGVIHLRLMGSPNAIGRAVISVVVLPFQRQAIRFFAHVGKKPFEGMPPLHCLYASAAIMLEARILRIVATLKHVGPYCVRLCLAHSMLERSPISCLAAARSGVPVTERSGDNEDRPSARAQAFPFGLDRSASRDTSNRSQFGEFLSWRDKSFVHRGIV